MPDIQFGIRLTADGSGFVGTMTAATAQVEKLSAAARGSAPDLAKMDAGMRESMRSAVALGSTIGNFATDAIKALAKWGAATVTAAAELKNWADETGSTVESLSKLTNYAKVSGQELGALRSATEKLSVGLTGTDEESKRAGKALALLGIQSRDPATAMFELAKTLDTYADGANKATLANDIFGRGGAKLLPLLKDMAQASDIAATTTMRQAEEAEKLEKGINSLFVQVSKARDSLLSTLVPALNDLMEQFKEGTRLAGGFWEALLLFGTINPFKSTVANLKELRAELAQLQKSQAGGFDKFLNDAFGNSYDVAIDKTKKKIEYLKLLQRQEANALISPSNMDARDYQAQYKPQAPVVSKPPTVPKERKEAIEKESDAMKLLIADYDKFSDLLVDVTKNGAQYDKVLVSLNRLYGEGIITLDQYVDAEERLFSSMSDISKEAEKLAKDSLKKLIDAEQAMLDIQEKLSTQATQALGIFADQNKRIELEVSLIGKSNLVRERALIIADAEIEKQKLLAAGDVEGLDLLQKQIDKRLELANVKDAKEKAIEYETAWKGAIESVANAAGDFITDFAKNGSSAFKNLWENFKNWALRALAQVAAKQVVVSLVGSVSGVAGASGGGGGNLLSGLGSLFGGGGGGAGAAAGGGDMASMLSNMFSGSGGAGGGLVTGLATSFALSGAGTALGLSTTGAALGAGAAAYGGAALAATGAATALTTAGTALLAAIPVVGWIAAAAIALWAIFGNKGGGPKSGGFSSTGDISSITKTDNSGRWFTPSGSDSSVQKLIDANAKGYTEILKALGGKGKAGFALGFDTDPEGTAPNRVHAGAFVNGRQVYDAALGNLGRDEETLKKALDVESKRSLLAALQASDLPDAIAAVLNSVLAKTATAEDIDRVVSLGAAFKDLMSALDGDVIADVEKAWTSSQRNRLQVLRDMGDSLTKLSANFDGSVDATRALTAATNEYRGAVAQTLLAIKQISASVGAMFADTRTQLQIAGLTPEALYQFWSNQADDAVRELATATDPTTIGLLAQKINASLSNAFSAVSPEQQAMVKNPLIDYITAADALVQSRLSAAATLVGTEASAPFTAVQTALNLAVDKMTQAATDQQTAATNANTAAINSNTAAANMNTAANTMIVASGSMIAAADRMGSVTIPISMPSPAWVNG